MARRKHLPFLFERTFNHFRDAMQDGLASGCTELVYVCMLVLFRSAINFSLVSFRKVDLSEQGISLLCYFTSTYAWLTKSTKVFVVQVQKTMQKSAEICLISGPSMVTYRVTYPQWIVYISMYLRLWHIITPLALERTFLRWHLVKYIETKKTYFIRRIWVDAWAFSDGTSTCLNVAGI